MGRKEKYF